MPRKEPKNFGRLGNLLFQSKYFGFLSIKYLWLSDFLCFTFYQFYQTCKKESLVLPTRASHGSLIKRKRTLIMLAKLGQIGVGPVPQRLSAYIQLWRPGVGRFRSQVRTWHHLASRGRRPTYKVEEDGHGCQLRASCPQQKEEDWQQMLAQG